MRRLRRFRLAYSREVISAVRFVAKRYIQQQVSEEVNRKLPAIGTRWYI